MKNINFTMFTSLISYQFNNDTFETDVVVVITFLDYLLYWSFRKYSESVNFLTMTVLESFLSVCNNNVLVYVNINIYTTLT